jgi:hypothetical protein
MSEYRFRSSPMFYTPGMVNWVNAATARDLDAKARDDAAKLWLLGQMFPTATVETLLQILKGEFQVDGDDVVVKVVSRQDLDDAGPI